MKLLCVKCARSLNRRQMCWVDGMTCKVSARRQICINFVVRRELEFPPLNIAVPNCSTYFGLCRAAFPLIRIPIPANNSSVTAG